MTETNPSPQPKPFFHTPELAAAFQEHSRLIAFEKDAVIIDKGDDVRFVPLVVEGCVRIIREDENGDEVFLYHLYPGDTCTLSLSSCHTAGASMIRAIAEDHTELYMVPVAQATEWNRFPEWKSFLDQSYHKRFGELIQVIDLIAFRHMDEQVLHYLNERARATGSDLLHITHVEIAEELHTHREVISRILRNMELKGYVKLARNEIELKRPEQV